MTLLVLLQHAAHAVDLRTQAHLQHLLPASRDVEAGGPTSACVFCLVVGVEHVAEVQQQTGARRRRGGD
jgi:hypothetical protein